MKFPPDSPMEEAEGWQECAAGRLFSPIAGGCAEAAMKERMELLEIALDSLPEGMALLDGEGQVAFWNQAAEAITGYGAAELLEGAAPEGLQPLLRAMRAGESRGVGARGTLVQARHKLGHGIAVITRLLPLRDALGEAVGAAAVFHPAERLDALPQGLADEGGEAESSATDLEERLESGLEDLARGGEPLGVLWVAVDQGPELRRTHGAAACQAMEEKMRRALGAGLRPAEELGRWGEGEFVVIAHERTAEMLAGHARTLAGLARTADFRWWGDRLSLTVSIGAAQAEPGEPLPQLLERARAAMEAGQRQGGNCVTAAPRTPAGAPFATARAGENA